MVIDSVSKSIILIALYLDNKVPGIVSEIWIGKDKIKKLKSEIPNTKGELDEVIIKTSKMIDNLTDSRRSNYLTSIMHSLKYQIDSLDEKKFSYADFSKNAFGYKIRKVKEEEIREIEKKLEELEKKTGLSRQKTFQQYSLKTSEYKTTFKKYIDQARNMLPKEILDFPDKGFEFEVVTDKPWSAFNSHIAPYKSKLSLNSDVSLTKLDLYRLAFHEAYGGHHSELSSKDMLLTKDNRGEHGLVITFSPQTFISEAIAEGVFVLLGGLDEKDNDALVGWYYDRLIFALYNLATHYYFEDGLTRNEIKKKFEKYAVSNQSIENMLNFSTDKVFGKYAPVYYSAFNFISDLYNQTKNKKQLIKTLFTQPCNPRDLIKEFTKSI